MNPIDTFPVTSTLTIGIKGRHKPSCSLRTDPEGYTRPDACECFLGAPVALQSPPTDPAHPKREKTMTKTKTYWTIEDIVSEMESALARMGVVIVASTDDIPGDEQLSATATLSSMDAIKGTASYLYRHMLYGTTSPTLDEMLNPPPVQVTAYVSPNPHDGKNRSLGISVFYSTTATTTEDT